MKRTFFLFLTIFLIMLVLSSPVLCQFNYYIRDHLGSTRVVLDENGNTKEYYDYEPFGLSLREKITGSEQARYKFTGKELDDRNGLNWYDFGARYYDPKIGRFLSPDRFADMYPSLSPYQYAANNPVKFIDVNGDSIDITQAQRADQAFGTDYIGTLIADLQSKTGLSLSANAKGQLVYATDQNGNPIIATDKAGNQLGSAEARGLLVGAIGHSDMVSVGLAPNLGSIGYANNTLRLDPSQINSFISGSSEGLNSTTLGWAMTFMHELSHTPVGGSLHDPSKGSPFGATGQAVDRMNIIRSQLGSIYGQRTSYMGVKIGGTSYLPFDRSALQSIKRGIVPSTYHIKF